MALSSQLFHKLGLLFIGLAIAGTIGAAGYLTAEPPTWTIYVSEPPWEADPEPILISGDFETVEQALDYAGIPITPNDHITPARTEPLQPNTPISIQRAQAVQLITDEERRTIWSLQLTLNAFLLDVGITPRRTDRIFADGQPISLAQLDDTPLPTEVTIGRFLNITIQDGDNELRVRTEAQTVGEALQNAGIKVYAADGITPPLSQWLTPEMHIDVRRSMPLTIKVDGNLIQTRSHHTRVLDVLATAGIPLIGADYTVPDFETPLQPDQTIHVIRVTEDFRIEDDPIPYETIWQASEQLEIDTRGVLQAGNAGILRRRIRIRYENGVEVSQTPDGEWQATQPVPEILGYGTQIVLRTLNTPNGPVEYWRKVRMRVTSYTAATSGKAPDHPAYGITASGVLAGKGVVAVDRSVVPWRSDVYVEGYGVGFVGDTGGGVIGRWIDLGYDEDNFEWWAGYTDVYYLTPVPPTDKINYLIPTTLP